MASPEEEAAEWLRFAREDLATAEANAECDRVPPRNACFAAQQAAEKAIKALLVLDQIDFPRSHDLEQLQALVPSGPAVHALDADLPTLTQWAVEGRYPGEDEATADDVEVALAIARSVVEAVGKDLEPEGAE